MKVALYGQAIKAENSAFLTTFFKLLQKNKVDVCIYEKYYKLLKNKFPNVKNFLPFTSLSSLEKKPDILISIGGDGTMLRSILLVRDSGVPVAGLNLGRLGFLSSIPKEKMELALNGILNKEFDIEKRTLLTTSCMSKDLIKENNFALNDITITKRNSASMIKIHTELNGEYFNTYWGDGFIVSTPTGSTGYSLSCGGPIILPKAAGFVIAPIAPHNLTLRPVVIPDTTELKLKVDARTRTFLLTLDSRNYVLPNLSEITIKKAAFTVSFIRLHNTSFLQTLRGKMFWGVDTRN